MVNRLTTITLGICSLLLLLVAVLSLHWRFAHDSPLMLYVAFLMDRFHAVPYRDIFDMNLPGSYFAFYIIGHLSGYRDMGFRIADLLYLGAILAATWCLLKGLNRFVAWTAIVLFGLIYLSYGSFMSLQREYLLILPITLAVLLASGTARGKLAWRAGGIGLFFGVCATIKPHAIIAFPLLLWHLLHPTSDEPPRTRRSALLQIALPAVLGFCLPVALALGYLLHTHALSAFLDIASGYWPLYGSLSGTHRTVAGVWRFWNLWHGFLSFGSYGILLLPACAGVITACYDSALSHAQRRQVWLFTGMAVCYCMYPVLSGQFWDYHWLIFIYWLTVLIGLAFVARPGVRTQTQLLLPLVLLLCTLKFTLHFPDLVIEQCVGAPMEKPKEGRVDAIARYLNRHLRPGDRVQPLDWTGGAVHAMLLARARLATPFMYDFHFYHHVSHPYIQGLRRRFLQALIDMPPRFIVEITRDKPWVHGRDTTQQFPALDRYLLEHYHDTYWGEGFVIRERNGDREGT